jgi:predicted RNase H-like HicB family nuclease
MPTTASRKRPGKRDLRRPFDPKVLARARTIAADYQIVIWLEDGEFYGRGVELPGTFDDGKTPDECVAKTREALATTPASQEKRTEQINLRVTAEERLRLDVLAKQNGFKGVADYLRARGLAG